MALLQKRDSQGTLSFDAPKVLGIPLLWSSQWGRDGNGMFGHVAVQVGCSPPMPHMFTCSHMLSMHHLVISEGP